MSSRWILHIDMDAFYAAIEQHDHPEYREKPVIVGADPQAGKGRGVVSAASYEARTFGVHSALPIRHAFQRCPQGIFLPVRMSRYRESSDHIFSIFQRYTDLVEPLSLDEAFLDVSGSKRLLGEPLDLAKQIRERVFKSEHLLCSVGIAPNKFLAKLASDAAKPIILGKETKIGSGICLVTEENTEDFLFPLPVSAIWGVGPQTRKRLTRLGVKTVGDLTKIPVTTLTNALGQAAGAQLWRLCRGIDERVVTPNQKLKSIGHEETFPQDRYGQSELNKELSRIVDAVAGRLRKSEKLGKTISVKLRSPDFITTSRSETLLNATNTSAEILATAKTLLKKMDIADGVRLLGVSVSNLQDSEVRQLQLGEEDYSPQREIDEAVDEIRQRFGGDVIGPGSTVGPEGIKAKRRGTQQWGPQ